MTFRTLLRPGLLAATACLALAACSSSDDTDEGQSSAASTVATSGPTANGTGSTTAPAATDAAPVDNGAATGEDADVGSSVPDGGDDSTDTSAPDPVTEDDLVRFIAAAEFALEGTVHEGAMNDAPEIYIGIAAAACARFTAGDGFAVVASDLVAELSGSDPTDVEQLVGAILGAATRTICPEHAGLV